MLGIFFLGLAAAGIVIPCIHSLGKASQARDHARWRCDLLKQALERVATSAEAVTMRRIARDAIEKDDLEEPIGICPPGQGPRFRG
jgi:hypothetical protein